MDANFDMYWLSPGYILEAHKILKLPYFHPSASLYERNQTKEDWRCETECNEFESRRTPGIECGNSIDRKICQTECNTSENVKIYEAEYRNNINGHFRRTDYGIREKHQICKEACGRNKNLRNVGYDYDIFKNGGTFDAKCNGCENSPVYPEKKDVLLSYESNCESGENSMNERTDHGACADEFVLKSDYKRNQNDVYFQSENGNCESWHQQNKIIFEAIIIQCENQLVYESEKDNLENEYRLDVGCGNCDNQLIEDESFGKQKMVDTDNAGCKKLYASIKEKEFDCEVCGTQFETKSKLRVHMRRHSTHKPHICDICNKTFGFKSHLAVHTRTHTGEKPFKCESCEKQFANNGDLTRHERTHTGEKPYICLICGKQFTTNGALTVHTRTHTGEKPYKCKSCGKLFTNNSDLCKHERTHRGEKAFKCNACGMQFISNSDLIKHERTYTGERPFRCTICGKRFTTNGSLTVHTRTHTGEKPYKCESCGKQFHSNSNLTVHMKSHSRLKVMEGCT